MRNISTIVYSGCTFVNRIVNVFVCTSRHFASLYCSYCGDAPNVQATILSLSFPSIHMHALGIVAHHS